MKIKVCGMKQNITEVGSLQPDFLGFIFWEGSPRYFDGQIPAVGGEIKKVGVFVDAPHNTIANAIRKHGLHMVQLHGSESPEFCATLREQLATGTDRSGHIPIIKVFSVRDSFDFKLLEPYEAVCDYFLFDTKGELPGGNGYGFDWRLLNEYPSDKPFFLSGGIGPGALGQITEFLDRPVARYCHAIDVNSGFELDPGTKNIELLKPFIREIRSGSNLQ